MPHRQGSILIPRSQYPPYAAPVPWQGVAGDSSWEPCLHPPYFVKPEREWRPGSPGWLDGPHGGCVSGRKCPNQRRRGRGGRCSPFLSPPPNPAQSSRRRRRGAVLTPSARLDSWTPSVVFRAEGVRTKGGGGRGEVYPLLSPSSPPYHSGSQGLTHSSEGYCGQHVAMLQGSGNLSGAHVRPELSGLLPCAFPCWKSSGVPAVARGATAGRARDLGTPKFCSF